jgi:hypothetical protein
VQSAAPNNRISQQQTNSFAGGYRHKPVLPHSSTTCASIGNNSAASLGERKPTPIAYRRGQVNKVRMRCSHLWKPACVGAEVFAVRCQTLNNCNLHMPVVGIAREALYDCHASDRRLIRMVFVRRQLHAPRMPMNRQQLPLSVAHKPPFACSTNKDVCSITVYCMRFVPPRLLNRHARCVICTNTRYAFNGGA